jgi:hypothetical protein
VIADVSWDPTCAFCSRLVSLVTSGVLWFVPRDILWRASSKDQLEALVLGEGSSCQFPPTNRGNRFSSSLRQLSVASRGETGALLRPASDVVLRAGRRLLGGREGGRERTGLAGSSDLREHFGQAPIVLPGYPAGNDVVDQLIVGEYRQEELAQVGR